MFRSGSKDNKFAFKEAEFPGSSIQKVLQIPELLDMICAAVSKVSNSPDNKTYYSLDEADKAIHQLRLVSRAFRQAANAYFSIEIGSIEPRSPYSRYWAKNPTEIKDKITACGSFTHKINFDADNEKALEAAANHCTNIREVSLVLQEMPGCSVRQGDYSGALSKWASLPHNKLETVNAIMTLEDGVGRASFGDFDSLRQYFRGIKKLKIQCSNPNEHHTVECRNRCYTPIKWERFLSFVTYFRCLESLEFTGFFIGWSDMPARVLDPISLEPLAFRNLTCLDVGRRDLEVSVVFRLNRLLPCLKRLTLCQIKSKHFEVENWESTYEDNSDCPADSDDSDEDEDEGEDDKKQEYNQDMAFTEENSGNQGDQASSATKAPPLSPATASAPIPDKSTSTLASPSKARPVFDYSSSVHERSTLSIEELWVKTAHVADLAELSKWAPSLKKLSCMGTEFYGKPDKDQEDRMAALGPLNDRAWDLLKLDDLGTWRGRELSEYLQQKY
ncbi:hypothetical protein CPC16_002406 [Podila verticillata]|nr:hypothetical protein CPC16_002406 [Podila verticillata]KAI9233104.1 MAG: hypothetical protein BYD32DRAFT_138675 [Podila humilis]